MTVIDTQPLTTPLLEDPSLPVAYLPVLTVGTEITPNSRNTNIGVGRPATLSDDIWYRLIGPHCGWLCADDGIAPSDEEEDDCCVQICHMATLIVIPAIILTPIAQWSSQLWLTGCSAIHHIQPFYNPLAIITNVTSSCCLFMLYQCLFPLSGDHSFYRRETFNNHFIPSTLTNQWCHTIFTTPMVPLCCPSILPITITTISPSLILPSACLATSCIAGIFGAYTTPTHTDPTVSAEPIDMIDLTAEQSSIDPAIRR